MNLHIPNLPLKAVFFLHLILSVWALQSEVVKISYLFYNSFFLVTILWTIHMRDSEEGPFMAVCINIVSILLDIVTFCESWPKEWSPSKRFGAVCAISNLLLRPVSCIFLYRLFLERAGTYGNFVMPSGFDSVFGGSNRRTPYEDIDQSTSLPPNANGLGEQPPKDLGSADSLFPS